MPDVSGQSEGSARSTLEGLQLVVADPSQTEASDSVPEGDVIRMIGKADGTWLRPGDTVTLVVSSGPPLFPVPEVTGLTRDDAIAKLEANGFQVDFAVFWGPFPDSLTEVTGSDPGAGVMYEKGTRVYIEITAKR